MLTAKQYIQIANGMLRIHEAATRAVFALYLNGREGTIYTKPISHRRA